MLHLCAIHYNLRMKNLLFDARSLKLSDTEPTNMPCIKPEILLGGINESICVLMEVDTSCRLIEIDCRFCNTFPKRSESVAFDKMQQRLNRRMDMDEELERMGNSKGR